MDRRNEEDTRDDKEEPFYDSWSSSVTGHFHTGRNNNILNKDGGNSPNINRYKIVCFFSQKNGKIVMEIWLTFRKDFESLVLP